MESVIYFEEVSKVFKNTVALREASFEVPRGSIAGLLGPNGSGKTTSIKLALGTLRPSSGLVLVRGMEPWRDPDARQGVGFLPESPVYPRTVRVSQLLEHIAKLKGEDWNGAKRAASLVGLDKLLDKPVGSLSRGYLQRLGLALALVGEPELLLLDEPTANLDPNARVEILRLISTIRDMLDATVVVSSHILPELQEIVDYLVIISSGEVLDYGPVEDLAKRYEARMVYHVSTRNPRIVARSLITYHYVEGVMLDTGGLKVYVKSTHHRALEEVLEGLAKDRMIDSYSVATGLLGEIYEAVVSG